MTTNIVSGPSKFDLMLALFDRKPITRELEFGLPGPDKEAALIVISGLELEDGSGESWNYKGMLRRMLPYPKDGSPPPPRRVEGWYHTGRRQGTMRYSD